MAAIPASRASGQSVGKVADATKPRTWWTDDEVRAAVRLDCERRGVRVYSNLVENVVAYYGHLRMRAATNGSSTNTTQAARDLYIDVADAFELGRKAGLDKARDKKSSVDRWRAILGRVGALDVRSRPGKGFRFRLLTVPEDVATMARTRGCSSVGWSYMRRRLSLEQLRAFFVRRWRRRAGRGAGRPPLFFASRDLGSLEPSPYGEGIPGTDARARGRPPERSADAIWAACPADQRSAVDRLRVLGSEGGVEALRAAGQEWAPWSALALVLWERRYPDREPRFSSASSAQLERSAGQLVRLWGRRDVADKLVDWLAAPDWSVGSPEWSGDEPRTLRYFVLPLKQWARTARRHARGAPPPRPWRPRGRA